MASSSSSSSSSSTSSIPKSFKYDVYLSFRGQDIRKTFADHLYYSLTRQGIHTFMDDKKLKPGRNVYDQINEAIRDSRFLIIIFSKNYACSSLCLDELVQIMECRKTSKQTVIPVFYEMDPSEVRRQTGAVGKAFARHEMNRSAGKWRHALKEAADLAGWGSNNNADGDEAKFIQRIVEDISRELRSIQLSSNENLIGGMEPQIKDVLSSSETGFDDVSMIGVEGMVSVGKATLSNIPPMAFSSTSSIRKSFKYDVYLSFFGQDTRQAFVGHLYSALTIQGIHTFQDDKQFTTGVRDQINEAIQDSRYFIIIFSKNYASSSWCLDELVQIMECNKTTQQPVYPVFYDVDPFEVSKQSGAVREAFARLEMNEAAGKWRHALKEATDMVGWDLNNNADGDEDRLIQIVVEEISRESHSIQLSNNENLIHMEPRIKDILKSSETGFDDVSMIGVEGMVSVGKTTLSNIPSVAFSSTSSIGKSFEYDVYLSFRGEDTRKAFVGHLYSALTLQGIHTFKDDNQFMTRENLLDQINKAIRDSRFLIIIFSKNYASSSWCLDELVQIMECHNTTNQTVYPVYYDVEPAEIRRQSWAVGRAFAKHSNKESAGKWRHALKEATDLAGWELNNNADGNEARLIQIIVEDISRKSRSIQLSNNGNPIHMEPGIKDVLSSSETGIDDVRMIGVEGMVSVGKTTLASIPSVAFSSKSFIRKSFKYDVYLSFFGQDTRKAFVGHLYSALTRQGIHTFKDDKQLMPGRNIFDQINEAIQDSQFFIIIFSKNYASSSWCLDELVQIMECHKTTQQTVYPVFYDVEPAEVRKQIGAVGEAFARHSENEAAGKWRRALQEAASLAGRELKNTADGHEAEFIKTIVEEIIRFVEEISLELRYIKVHDNSTIVGMEPQIKEVLSSLGSGFGDVHMIGIMGMGGVGKTTLSRAIFNELSSNFEVISFVENVREVSNASLSGLKSLQKKLLSGVLNDERVTISSVNDGKNKIKKELGDRKVLLVLDDVDDINQLKALAGEHNWFGEGSIIIITTRDEQLLRAHGVRQIHDVRLLSEEEALCLFSWYAFGRNIPSEWYEQLSLEVVRRSACLPLAIKVLGSFLCGKDTPAWIDVLQNLNSISLEESLRTISLKQTMEILELSYISLGDVEKEIFLDVACFMKGLRQNDAVRILESCGFPKTGLRTLELKSLLTISNERLDMHDYIEEMGRNIVRRSHPDQPNLHSRLWIRNEIEDILANHLGCEATKRIQLSEPQLMPKTVMEGVGRMEELRCLVVESEDDNEDQCDWEFDVDKEYLPNALRFLRWVHYPVPSLPVTFRADNLVALELVDSRITQLWEGGERQVLNKLRFLDLSRSMLTTLDLELTPSLECLELKGCTELENLLTPDGSLTRLVHLDLIGCSSFDSFSFIKQLESLQLLSLPKLELIAKSLGKFSRSAYLPRLEFECTYTEEQPSAKSVSLNLKPSTKLESVSGSIFRLQHLRQLTFSGCIPEVPMDIDQLTNLEKLSLLSTDIKCLPDSLCELKHLKSLKLESCQNLDELPENLGWLVSLEELSLLSTGIRCLPDSICMLKHLKSLQLKSCSDLKRLPENLGQLQRLEKLNLLSARITRLPDSICLLVCLKSLKLESCWFLERLPEDLGRLKCLEKLNLKHCESLGEIPNSICYMKNLERFHLPFCYKVKDLPEELGELQCLKELNVTGTGISHIPLSISAVEGLRIVGSVAVLKSCGFASEIKNTEGESFCYTPVRLQIAHAPTEAF